MICVVSCFATHDLFYFLFHMIHIVGYVLFLVICVIFCFVLFHMICVTHCDLLCVPADAQADTMELKRPVTPIEVSQPASPSMYNAPQV